MPGQNYFKADLRSLTCSLPIFSIESPSFDTAFHFYDSRLFHYPGKRHPQISSLAISYEIGKSP